MSTSTFKWEATITTADGIERYEMWSGSKTADEMRALASFTYKVPYQNVRVRRVTP